MTILATNLVKKYGKRKVVDGVNFKVARGEIVGLLGPNGAGKTTTFYMIVGLVKANDGKIFLDGKDITRLPMHRRARLGIGYLAQEPSIFRKMTVEENILSILEVVNCPKEEQRERLETLLKEFHIEHVRKQKGASLSGGERRRVEIARALATNPSFILLDEPFAGVDPIAVSDIQDIIAHLKEKGLGVLITDHSVRETLSITDRAYIMHEGKILISGSSEEIAKSEIARKFYLGERFTL
ncbi:LPS export ABC transporter ATP-binding protein [Anoxybacter fermentans]|uniref:LPS export ABC transporter ATP-binding protein n=1 Tax=Anoxybacter fermentans TaxID=1323375 RepID=A0A3Q9HRG4_9FIRM|nr:LPS export ABC transporter ATP-binding protein [Anoxybacter fermentans]AZR73942.1 LPS export ABC transporter ATP-binding protein [Anoxybacter fermentans]